jgi:ZIP family zinc transporter
MSAAIWWGMLASATLFIGQALARPLARSPRVTGLIMGFGAGTLLSAIAYELVPESNIANGTTDAIKIAIWLLVGALAYYAGDRLLDWRGGSVRGQIRPSAESGSGTAMFLGALLDGMPEAFIIGLGLAVGGSISWAFLAAVALSNIPQGVAGTTGLKAAGIRDGRIFAMWASLTLASGLAAGLGYWVADKAPHAGLAANAFAAGALLMMLADSMIPEAYEHGGRTVGLLTVLGFLCAAALSVAQ